MISLCMQFQLELCCHSDITKCAGAEVCNLNMNCYLRLSKIIFITFVTGLMIRLSMQVQL